MAEEITGPPLCGAPVTGACAALLYHRGLFLGSWGAARASRHDEPSNTTSFLVSSAETKLGGTRLCLSAEGKECSPGNKTLLLLHNTT